MATVDTLPETSVSASCEPAIPAPVSGWRRLLGDWAVVGSAEMVCQALGSATSLLLRVFLSPAQMGVWQAVKLFLSYANYANLGISKGAARELTIAMGRGDVAAVQHGLNLAFTVNTLSSLVYAVVLVAAGLWVGLTSQGEWAGAWAVGLAVGGALAVLGRYVTFQITVLRAKQAFRLTSQVSVLEGALTLAVGCLATWLWGLPGLYVGTLTVMLGSLVYLSWRGDVELRWAWDRKEIRRLIAIGSPILLASTLMSFFRSLDKLMILAYLDDREFQLGCYSLTLMVGAQLFGIGNMLSIVMGPRYGEKFGDSGDRRQVARLAARATELQAAIMVLPTALALVLAAPVLGRLLPDYRVGLAPLVWALPGVVLQSLALPPSQYLVAVDRQNRVLFAVLIATGLALAGNHLALTGGYGLIGVAAATAISYAAYFFLIAAISIWPDLDPAERFRYLAMLLLALVPAIGLAIVLEYALPGLTSDWPITAAKLLAVLSAWGASVRIGWHHGRWREALRKGRDQEEGDRGQELGVRGQDIPADPTLVTKSSNPQSPIPNPSLSDLERLCQKPDHRRIGNWMARRISRPAALRVTRVVAPWGASANMATLIAWSCSVAAAVAFGWGTTGGWLLGAMLLQAWYLWDHVDGQLARLRGTASLDGVQLDYLMHHAVNLTLPLGVGWGLFAQSTQPLWLLGGLVWGLGVLGLGLQHDARYKAFIQRLKSLEGTLQAVGGGACRRSPQPPVPRHPLRLAAWTARKLCEIHVIMNLLGLLSLIQWTLGDRQLLAGRGYLVLSASVAVVVAGWTIIRSQRRQACEEEFAAWFRIPPDCELTLHEGQWHVTPSSPSSLAPIPHPLTPASQSSAPYSAQHSS